MRLVLLLFVLTALLSRCSPVSKKAVLRAVEKSETRNKHHAGFVVYDPVKNKTVFEYQGDRYFTPASNTKIFTLLTALTLLGDSVPAIRYIEKDDSLIFWGFGDPSFLNKTTFSNTKIFDFLKSSQAPLYFSSSNFHSTRFGPGWAWDDYNDNYSQERSSFPIYGNSVFIYPLPDQIVVQPHFFARFLNLGAPVPRVSVFRDEHANRFTLHPGTQRSFREIMVPFKPDPYLTAELLADTLRRAVSVVDRPVTLGALTMYSVPSDSLYKTMMQESDNHIAEQLLLMCAAVLSDTLKPEIAIREMKKNFFNSFPDNAVWRDGSGLSRYNLFTPRLVVEVWKRIYELVPESRLFPLLATGGVSGTIKSWYRGDTPYLFGKTGTLSNNHSISGYLVTKKGKRLIFAYMNANYTVSVNEIRNDMQGILKLFYENY